MWQANFLIIMCATLGSFCLELVGCLDIGRGTKLISIKNKESNGTNPQAGFEDYGGYQSNQPASTGNNGQVVRVLPVV